MPRTQRVRVLRLGAVLLAALVLCWPAIWNRYPLLYPDSLGYLVAGHDVWVKLLGIANPPFNSDRSEIFAAGLYLLHYKSWMTPFLAVQAVSIAWVLWLTVRSLFADRVSLRLYLALVALLAFLTSIAWYVSVILADILGPVLYLAIYLLVFAWEKLARWERIALSVLAVWAMTAHATHLVVGAALCLSLAVLALITRKMRSTRPQVWLVTALVLASVILLVGVHKRLYGKYSVFGNPPAFVMARLLGDGPARLYLQAHCQKSGWEICRHVGDLPTDEGSFLWPPQSIWRSSTPSQQDELRREQTPLAIATLRAYPRQQIETSASNFEKLLFVVGPWDFGSAPLFAPGGLDIIVPGLEQKYLNSRQVHDGMPQAFARSLERPTLAIAMGICVLALPWLWAWAEYKLLQLDCVVLFVLLCNGFLSAVFSCNDPRLQDRVSWMSAFVAGLILARFWQRYRQRRLQNVSA